MIKKLLAVDWNSKGMKAFDWILALASVAVGLYLQSPLWIGAGLVGALCAWWRPMGRVQGFVQSVIKPRGGASRDAG